MNKINKIALKIRYLAVEKKAHSLSSGMNILVCDTASKDCIQNKEKV